VIIISYFFNMELVGGKTSTKFQISRKSFENRERRLFSEVSNSASSKSSIFGREVGHFLDAVGPFVWLCLLSEDRHLSSVSSLALPALTRSLNLTSLDAPL